MAESYRFFGSATGDTRQYSQVDFAEVMGTIIGNGYLGQVGNELLVIQNTPDNMTVLVKSGQAWINGYWYKNDSDKSITVSTADASYPRIDLIVLRLDILNARSIVATIKTGTPASVPVVPSLTQTSQMWEIPLAQVYVAAGVTSIDSSDIIDLRTQALLQDTDEILAQVELKAPINNPTFTGAVSGITKSMVGLGNVDNTSDINKPISTATQTALNGKADSSHTHAIADVTNLQTSLDAKAPLASPTLTGTPATPTAIKNTDTTQIASTAFVQNQVRQIDMPSAKTASFTLDATQEGQLITCYSSSTITVTVPSNASVQFAIGTMIMFNRYGSGLVTFSAGSGATIRSVSSKLSIANLYEVATLVKVETDVWLLFGALA